MIHEDRKQKIYDRLSSLNIEILCNLPFDEELEETIYNGEPVNTLTDTPIIAYIDQILDRIGGNNGNT